MKHRRVVVSRHGGPGVLQVVEENTPEPGAGEVRLKVAVAGVSAYDVMVRSFWFPGEFRGHSTFLNPKRVKGSEPRPGSTGPSDTLHRHLRLPTSDCRL